MRFDKWMYEIEKITSELLSDEYSNQGFTALGNRFEYLWQMASRYRNKRENKKFSRLSRNYNRYGSCYSIGYYAKCKKNEEKWFKRKGNIYDSKNC